MTNNQTKNQMTKEGFDALNKEYQELLSIKRPAAVDALQKARAMGDLSENSAYTAAKEEQALVEGRILEIEEILKGAEIIQGNGNKDTITLGSTIIVNINGVNEQFQIVGEFEADPAQKKLSHTSPLGKALLGKKRGESIEINVPAGNVKYTVVQIS